MEIVSPDFVLGREVMSKEQTFRSEDNDFLVQNVQPLRSVQVVPILRPVSDVPMVPINEYAQVAT
jgi:hypothetical protein